MFLLKFIFYVIYFYINTKIIKINKKYKKITIFKNFNTCLNCHNSNLNKNLNFYRQPKIINQNILYLKYSFRLYKNFKRKSIYMNLISRYLSLSNTIYIFNFLKCF